MEAFARVRTKSLLLRLWPIKNEIANSDKVDLINQNSFIDSRLDEKKQFLDGIKNGGAWFS